MGQTEKQRNKQIMCIMVILALITIVSLGITIWALFFREPDVILTPDYAPQDIEQNQQSLEDDTDDKMDAAEGGGAVGLSYSDKVTITLSDESASLLFLNPGKSTQDMVVQIVIQEQVIVQSGRITPGHKVTNLELLDGTAKKLATGGYDGQFVVLYYDPDSGEKAVVTTEIPIIITVEE